MKTLVKTGLLTAALTVGALFTTPNASAAVNDVIIDQIVTSEIKITIDKDTKDSDFKDISKQLKKHDIDAKFTKIKRNKDNEIIAIKIELKDKNGNESSTSLSSNEPIDEITLGADNDSLYITSANSNSFSFNGRHSLSKHFDFSFDDDKKIMIINGKKFDFDKMKDQIKDSFVFEEDENGKKMILKFNDFDFDFDFDSDEHDGDHNIWIHKNKGPKYKFIDNPDIEKLIIIDGKEAKFKKLDELAKADKLDKVDFLKSETAQSIYGKKAKDGAIIATTKK